MSKSGSQSECPVRVRMVNVKGSSCTWHEVGLAPTLPGKASYYDYKLVFERLKLLQRFLFIMLKDVFVASRTGIMIDSTLVFIRFNSIVCDQN